MNVKLNERIDCRHDSTVQWNHPFFQKHVTEIWHTEVNKFKILMLLVFTATQGDISGMTQKKKIVRLL